MYFSDAPLEIVENAPSTATRRNLARKAQLLHNKRYKEAIVKERLTTEHGIVYYYEEPRNIRTTVVPPTLRAVAITACHASPIAGHSGIKRTYFQVITRCR